MGMLGIWKLNVCYGAIGNELCMHANDNVVTEAHISLVLVQDFASFIPTT